MALDMFALLSGRSRLDENSRKRDAANGVPLALHVCGAPSPGCLAQGRRVWILAPGAPEALRDVFPVDDVEKVLDVLRTLVLILQVVGVLPDVEDEQGYHTPLGQVLVLFGLEDNQAVVVGPVGEDPPAAAFDGVGRRLKVGLEGL